ncbi:YchJ family protein [bacterium]|nr:YchJ family protein [bacterium]
MKCACGQPSAYEKCCGPFLEGAALPETAEQLMRSRYTAFTKADLEYIKKTLAPESRKGFDAAGTKKWAEEATWKGLEVLRTEAGKAGDEEGEVEFTATYAFDGQGIEHHEVAQFRKDKTGQWLFVDGESHTHREGEGHHHHEPQEPVVRAEPKIGRNDPCSCGSGKKFKKCCG